MSLSSIESLCIATQYPDQSRSTNGPDHEAVECPMKTEGVFPLSLKHIADMRVVPAVISPMPGLR